MNDQESSTDEDGEVLYEESSDDEIFIPELVGSPEGDCVLQKFTQEKKNVFCTRSQKWLF